MYYDHTIYDKLNLTNAFWLPIAFKDERLVNACSVLRPQGRYIPVSHTRNTRVWDGLTLPEAVGQHDANTVRFSIQGNSIVFQDGIK